MDQEDTPTTAYAGRVNGRSAEERERLDPEHPAAKTSPRANPEVETDQVEAGKAKLERIVGN